MKAFSGDGGEWERKSMIMLHNAKKSLHAQKLVMKVTASPLWRVSPKSVNHKVSTDRDGKKVRERWPTMSAGV